MATPLHPHSQTGLAAGTRTIHPVWLRFTHWLNALAVSIMITSGWRIYNASPLYDFRFAAGMTLGGWLGGALQWHFAGMWLLTANGLFYLAMNLGSGRLIRRFFPLSLRAFAIDLTAALRGRLSHADLRHYNAVQRLAYLFAMFDIAVLVLSGLVLWKSVQFATLRTLLGGYDAARHIHFIAMALLSAFIVVHVLMVALVPRTLAAMIRGR
ncbi:cytochrome b/b6 domain-containing protein [Bordetella sp. 02P26C-1]|uniref:cytochrome b/b6 domain-containing protein n=1 Tax=Bordetella sp. 02P26C-1 TaxID=2683195 RepID=UPI001354618D|nr:cytochrome b/b6 domain-containing protein [Bordetella sp. 02P26C-1]MVW79074.1 cytochrome B [Bordetella sp. 02P26C-1]